MDAYCLFFPRKLVATWASLVAQTVKRLPTMWETRVQSLGQEDLLEKEMATHYSILAWKIPWMEEPGRLESMGSKRVRHDWVTSVQFSSVQLLSRVRLFATPWTEAHQASVSITNSWSLLKLMSINRVSDAIQPSHPLSFPSPPAFILAPAFSLVQHQGLF